MQSGGLAEAVVDCSAQEFVSVLVDENPKKKTPYVAEARVVDRPDANTKIKYTHLAFPIIDDRDYFIIVHVDQNLDANGKGVYRANWKPWGLDRPARDGIVRVTTNEGFWEVKSIEGEPSKCSATYYLYSDPGGALPAWIIDQGNKRVLPDVIHAIYKDVLEKRAAQGVGGGGASK